MEKSKWFESVWRRVVNRFLLLFFSGFLYSIAPRFRHFDQITGRTTTTNHLNIWNIFSTGMRSSVTSGFLACIVNSNGCQHKLKQLINSHYQPQPLWRCNVFTVISFLDLNMNEWKWMHCSKCEAAGSSRSALSFSIHSFLYTGAQSSQDREPWGERQLLCAYNSCSNRNTRRLARNTDE